MEDSTYYPIHDSDNNTDLTEVIRWKRDAPPSDYTLKIESFSFFSEILSRADAQKYESEVFEAGGYIWRLSLYPNGDLKRKGNGYISLYLVLVDTDLLPIGLEINVEFKLFLYDQIEDKYLIVQDGGERVRRFHKLKTERGFSQFISIATFHNASNGYLVNDSCAFGAEVCVLKNKSKGESLSRVLNPNVRDSDFTWSLAFSKLISNFHYSEYFIAGERSWRLILSPSFEGKYLSLYLEMSDSESSSPSERNKVYAECILLIKDQVHNNHFEKSIKRWFTYSYRWGFLTFLTLDDLNDPSNGYLVDDIFIAEVKFLLIYGAKSFS